MIHTITPALYQQAIERIEDGSVYHLKTATQGKTPTFIDTDLVFKKIGIPRNILRQNKSNLAHQIQQSQSLDHLVIPKTRTYKKFLLETKLPVTEFSLGAYLRFYALYHTLFTKAVSDFVKFLHSVEYPYILSYHSSHPYSHFLEKPILRFDNIMLFAKNGEGFLGLADLERISERKNPVTSEICCLSLLAFPYHLEIILQTAALFDATIVNQTSRFLTLQQQALIPFEKVTTSHLSFLNAHAVTVQTPFRYMFSDPTVQYTQNSYLLLYPILKKIFKQNHTLKLELLPFLTKDWIPFLLKIRFETKHDLHTYAMVHYPDFISTFYTNLWNTQVAELLEDRTEFIDSLNLFDTEWLPNLSLCKKTTTNLYRAFAKFITSFPLFLEPAPKHLLGLLTTRSVRFCKGSNTYHELIQILQPIFDNLLPHTLFELHSTPEELLLLILDHMLQSKQIAGYDTFTLKEHFWICIFF